MSEKFLNRLILRVAHQNPHFRSSLIQEMSRSASHRKEALRMKQFERMMGLGGSFGIISAYSSRSKKENQTRHGQLMADLQQLGFRPVQLRGSWEGVTERSMLIKNIPPGVLFELGRKYGQDAVIYKSKDGVLGMYHTKGAPKAEIAVDPQGEPAFEAAADKSLYSKSRGLSFGFGFLWGKDVPWDGHTPIGRKQMRQFVSEQFG